MLGEDILTPDGLPTFRFLNTYDAWADLDLDHPSRVEWYLMVLAAEMRRNIVKNKNAPKPEQFKLKFVWKEPDESETELDELDPDEASLRIIQRFSMGADITVLNPHTGQYEKWDGSLYPFGKPDQPPQGE